MKIQPDHANMGSVVSLNLPSGVTIEQITPQMCFFKQTTFFPLIPLFFFLLKERNACQRYKSTEAYFQLKTLVRSVREVGVSFHTPIPSHNHFSKVAPRDAEQKIICLLLVDPSSRGYPWSSEGMNCAVVQESSESPVVCISGLCTPFHSRGGEGCAVLSFAPHDTGLELGES